MIAPRAIQVALAILMPALALLALTLLPIVKGAVVGVLWGLAKPHRTERTAP